MEEATHCEAKRAPFCLGRGAAQPARPAPGGRVQGVRREREHALAMDAGPIQRQCRAGERRMLEVRSLLSVPYRCAVRCGVDQRPDGVVADPSARRQAHGQDHVYGISLSSS
jgi:hypothetical protein